MILSDSSYIFKSGALVSEIRIGSETIWETEPVPVQEIWYKTISGNPIVPKRMVMASNQGTAAGIYIARFVCQVDHIKDARSYKDGCMSNTDLEYVWMPNVLKVIGSRCFQGCFELKSFTIGPKVTGIGAFAFCGCIGLTEIISLAKVPPVLGTGAFKEVDPEIPVYVKDPAAYQGWGGFKNIIKL
jgi:hypothetical protein